MDTTINHFDFAFKLLFKLEKIERDRGNMKNPWLVSFKFFRMKILFTFIGFTLVERICVGCFREFDATVSNYCCTYFFFRLHRNVCVDSTNLHIESTMTTTINGHYNKTANLLFSVLLISDKARTSRVLLIYGKRHLLFPMSFRCGTYMS